MARLYAATLFLSALLLFSVQPLVARMLLPSLGGTPVVWNTAMVFFQGMLVLGYLWAHLSLKWFGLRKQRWIHVGLIVIAGVILPIVIEPSTEAAEAPIPWLLATLGVAVALPFFALSAIAPMLQRWFATVDETDDPYWLYAASNLGSFAALLGYPLLAEPLMGLRTQSIAWTAGYGVLALAVLLCARKVDGPDRVAAAPAPIPWRDRARWVGMASIPSALLIAVTTFITTDLASVPLLWVVPLAIYLLSFVVVFATRRLVSVEASRSLLIVVALPFFALLSFDVGRPIWATFLVHLAVFATVCLLYHGQLADERPPAANLTEFYIWLSVGGVVGGSFVSIVAPFIFEAKWEYPLLFAVAIAWLGRPKMDGDRRWRLAAAGAVAGLLAAVVFVAGGRIDAQAFDTIVVAFFVGMAFSSAVVAVLPRQGMVITALVGLLATFLVASSTGTLERRRSHLAQYSIAEKRTEAGEFHLLYHGRVRHGAQSQDPRLSHLPLAYFHPNTPVGGIFEKSRERKDTRPVGVVGLGIGALSSYAQPGQEFTFFEIDPVVVELARDTRYFNFLEQCAGECSVVIGDGRIALTEVPDEHFQILVMDAYNSDAIPIHLLTREAMELYLQKVTEDGVVVFHVSNSFLDVGKVVEDVAAASGFASHRYKWWPRQSYLYEIQVNAAEYVAVARTHAALDAFTNERWDRNPGDPDGVVWTDDHANILSIYEWH